MRAIADWRTIAAPGATLLVAVSGGADSVFLLHWLKENFPDLRLVVGHVNHALRGPESEADEAFVRSLADELGLPCRVEDAAPTDADDEATLRELRHAALFRMADAADAVAVATAHHADDRAEWFLIAALRASGPDALGGPREVQHHAHGILLHPLIEWRRTEMRAWLEARRLLWREDSSNANPRHLRNRIRHEVLPLLESIQPGAAEALAAAGRFARQAGRFHEEAARRLLAAGLLPYPPLVPVRVVDARALPHPIDPDLVPVILRLIAAIPGAPTLRRALCEALAEAIAARSGDEARFSQKGLHFTIGPRWWIAHTLADDATAWRLHNAPLPLSVPFVHDLAREETLDLDTTLQRTAAGTFVFRHDAPKPIDGNDIVIDRESISGRLRVAPVHPDEAIALRQGRKSVADCLKEAAIPTAVRDRIWGLKDDEKIVWIPGVRQDARTLYRQGSAAVRISLIRAVGE